MLRYSSVSVVAACSSLWGSSGVSFSSSLDFPVKESRVICRKNTWKKKKDILKRSSFMLPSDEQVWAVAVNVQAVHQIPNCLNHLCWESNQENLAIRLDKGASLYITRKIYLKWLFHLVSRSDTVKLCSVPTSLPSLSLASFPSNTASSDRQ